MTTNNKEKKEKEFTVANEDVKLSQVLPEEIKKDMAAGKDINSHG